MADSSKKNLILREFGALNTLPRRNVIGDKEFSWLAEFMPIGNGNMKMVPGPSAALATITVPGQSIYYFASATINASNYMYCFLTDGSAYEVNTDSGAVVKFANAGRFSGTGTRCCQWKNERILIVDPANGYFDYDRQTLTSYKNTIYNASIQISGAFASGATAPVIVPSYGSATFSSTLGATTVQAIVATGSGYQVGDILVVSGGTFTSAAQIKVTAINGTGGVTGAVLFLPGTYTTAATNAVSVTGGYGTSATFNLGFGLSSVTVTNPGSGEYINAPTLLVNPSSTVGSSMLISRAGNYTSAPSSPVSTTGGTGTGLTVTATFGLVSAAGVWTVAWPPVGYQIGDVLTATGGTFSSAATIQITNIYYTFNSIGAATAANYVYSILSSGVYTVMVGTLGTTGGHGTGLTINSAVMGLTSAVIANAGSGYANNDVLTLSGGSFTTAAQVAYKTGGTSGGASVTANLNLSISGTAVASYAGHVWMVTNSRTVVFSAPSSYQDFLTADAAGSFILSDETMRSAITALKAANNYMYIAGATSMFMLSDVTVQQPASGTAGSPVTLYSLNNLTTSFGTDLPDAILPHYRSLLYGSDYGWYMLTGVTPQKISDPLDGFLANANFSRTTAGQCILYGQLCECWLVQYTDPVSLVTTAVLMIYFNNKWFLSTQLPSLSLIAGGVANDAPALFGTDGSNIYRLFADTTTSRAFKIQTKQWDMGNPVMTKLATRVGMDMNLQNATTFTVSADTETGSTTTSLPIPGPGYYFSITNIGATGNYVGLTITGNATPGDVITGIFMEYAMHTPWSYAKK